MNSSLTKFQKKAILISAISLFVICITAYMIKSHYDKIEKEEQRKAISESMHKEKALFESALKKMDFDTAEIHMEKFIEFEDLFGNFVSGYYQQERYELTATFNTAISLAPIIKNLSKYNKYIDRPPLTKKELRDIAETFAEISKSKGSIPFESKELTDFLIVRAASILYYYQFEEAKSIFFSPSATDEERLGNKLYVACYTETNPLKYIIEIPNNGQSYVRKDLIEPTIKTMISYLEHELKQRKSGKKIEVHLDESVFDTVNLISRLLENKGLSGVDKAYLIKLAMLGKELLISEKDNLVKNINLVLKRDSRSNLPQRNRYMVRVFRFYKEFQKFLNEYDISTKELVDIHNELQERANLALNELKREDEAKKREDEAKKYEKDLAIMHEIFRYARIFGFPDSGTELSVVTNLAKGMTLDELYIVYKSFVEKTTEHPNISPLVNRFKRNNREAINEEIRRSQK